MAAMLIPIFTTLNTGHLESELVYLIDSENKKGDHIFVFLDTIALGCRG